MGSQRGWPWICFGFQPTRTSSIIDIIGLNSTVHSCHYWLCFAQVLVRGGRSNPLHVDRPLRNCAYHPSQSSSSSAQPWLPRNLLRIRSLALNGSCCSSKTLKCWVKDHHLERMPRRSKRWLEFAASEVGRSAKKSGVGQLSRFDEACIIIPRS
jgi:hypothetical protein